MNCLFFFVTIIAFLVDNTTARLEFQTSFDTLRGKCECGFFPNNKQPQLTQPLVTKFIMNSPCPADKSCKKICEILGSRFKIIGSSLICATGKKIDHVLVSTFYRVCDQSWFYTGISNKEPICCKNFRVLQCNFVTDIYGDNSEPLKIIIQEDE